MTTSRADLTPKPAASTESRTVDFLGDLPSGDTISTASVAASVYSGTDASPSSLISGSATISGSRVTQKLTGGTEGVMYLLVWTANTAAGLVLKKTTILAVVPSFL